MKTVTTQHGYLTFINNIEAKVFDKIKYCDFVSVNSLSESEKYNADQLVQKNVLEKVKHPTAHALALAQKCLPTDI